MLSISTQDKFSCYQWHEIPFVWPLYRDQVQKALDEGSDYTLDEIFQGLSNREMQLWAYGIDAALVTSVKNQHNRRYCLLLALGGENMREWLGCLDHIENWAREQGCTEMRIYGRRGWSKLLGYDIQWTMMSKPLWQVDRTT